MSEKLRWVSLLIPPAAKRLSYKNKFYLSCKTLSAIILNNCLMNAHFNENFLKFPDSSVLIFSSF